MPAKHPILLPRLVAAALMLSVASIAPSPVPAAGSSDGGSRYDSSSAASKTVSKANKAIKDNDFAAAYTILEDGLGSEPDNADIHNLLGFSARKMGRYEDSMRHYRTALALDPKHKGALEYMGELYLTLNQPDEARALLQRLDDICWLGCSEERELKAAIEAWEAANG
ncbi:MAG: tetratricopeptide repeat protein [Candidatus Puniceispirillales bacterium]